MWGPRLTPDLSEVRVSELLPLGPPREGGRTGWCVSLGASGGVSRAWSASRQGTAGTGGEQACSMGGCLVEAASVGEPGWPCAARWAEVGCGPPAGSGGWALAVAGGPGTTERGVAHSDTCGLQPHFPPPHLSRGSGKLGALPLCGSQSAGLPALLPPSARPWAATCRLQPRNGLGPGGCHQHGLEGGHPGQSSVLPARLLRGLRLKEAPKAPIWGTGDRRVCGGWDGVGEGELFKLGWPSRRGPASAGRNRLVGFGRIYSGQKLGLLPCLTAHKSQLQI